MPEEIEIMGGSLRTFLFRCTIILILNIQLIGCSSDKTSDSPYLVRVNDFRLTQDAFDAQLKFEAEVDEDFHLSLANRKKYLEDLIQTQLLIQEAKKHKLDEREAFRQTIERYWQSTLIRDLLAQKGEELKKTTVVSEEEAVAYYKENKERFGELPFDQVSAKIRSGLEEDKVAARLNNWVDGLRKTADIDIRDADLRSDIKSEKK